MKQGNNIRSSPLVSAIVVEVEHWYTIEEEKETKETKVLNNCPQTIKM